MTVVRGIALTHTKDRALRWRAVVVAVALGAAGVVSCAQTPFDLATDVPTTFGPRDLREPLVFLAAPARQLQHDGAQRVLPASTRPSVLEDRHHVVIDGGRTMFPFSRPATGSPPGGPSEGRGGARAHFRLIGGSDEGWPSMNIWGRKN